MFTALHSCFPVKIHQNQNYIWYIHQKSRIERAVRFSNAFGKCFLQIFFFVLSKSQYNSTQEHIQITDMRACMVNRTVYLRHTALMRTTRSDFMRQPRRDDSSRSVKRGRWCRLLSAMTINVCASLNEQKTYRTTSIFTGRKMCLCVCVCVCLQPANTPFFNLDMLPWSFFFLFLTFIL